MVVTLHSAILTIALVLTTATQWRISGLPVGPGELLLGAWLIGTAVGIYRLPKFPGAQLPSKAFALFWMVSLPALAMGAWQGYQAHVTQSAQLVHDSLAYLLVCSSSLAIAWWPYTPAQIWHQARVFTVTMLGVGVILWIVAHVRVPIPGLDVWYGGMGGRFKGWSVNPNQMALLLVMAPFLALHFMSSPSMAIWGRRFWGVAILTALAFAAGWATDSGALRIAWSVCLPLLVLFYGVQWVRRAPGWGASLRLLIASLILWWLLQGFSGLIVHQNIPSMEEVYHSGVDIPVRLTLLKNGWQALLSSPWFGLGPGSFSGLDGPFRGSEAHNSLMDWGVNSGLVGVSALLGLVFWLFYRLWRTRQYALLAGVLALSVFAMGHHVLRHPLVWAWLVLVARLTEPDDAEC